MPATQTANVLTELPDDVLRHAVLHTWGRSPKLDARLRELLGFHGIHEAVGTPEALAAEWCRRKAD